MKARHWSWVGLAFVMVLNLWLRAHTFGPTIKAHLGVDLGDLE